MSSPSNKKLSIAYIYKILLDYSDEDHPLKQQDIIAMLQSHYGMECERKAVSANLQTLEELGISVQRLPNQGVYLGQRDFESSEVRFLVDAVFSCRSIPSRHAQELSEKLFQKLSIYQRKTYHYIYKANQITRSDNRQMFYAIELLGEAITQKKQVSFHYISYNAQGQIKRPTVANPYHLINNNGKYFLVCFTPPGIIPCLTTGSTGSPMWKFWIRRRFPFSRYPALAKILTLPNTPTKTSICLAWVPSMRSCGSRT